MKHFTTLLLTFATILTTLVFSFSARAQDNLPEPSVFVLYVLYHDVADVDAQALFRKHNLGKSRLVDSLETFDGAGVELLSQRVGTDVEVPPEEALQYFGHGFNAERAADLKDSKYAITIIGAGPFDQSHRLYRDISLTTEKMANELKAYVVDGQDSQTFIPEAFSELRMKEIHSGQLSVAQFGVRAYPHEQGFRGVTMGLDKFGQFNFAIPTFEGPQMARVNGLMELASQHFIEANQPIAPGILTLDISKIENTSVREQFLANKKTGVTGKASFQLDFIESVSGDPEIILAPVFGDRSSAAQISGLEKVLVDLFGEGEKPTEGVSMEQIQEAVAVARGRAVAIMNGFDDLKINGYRMSVAIDRVDPKEVVWLEVMGWKDGKGHGILLTNATGVNSGSTMEFSPDFIMDYRLTDKDKIVDSGGIDEMVKQLKP